MKNFSNIEITDQFIIENFIDKNNHISGAKCQCIKANPNIQNYLMQRYSDITYQTAYTEIIYRIANKIDVVPKCPICGAPKQYKTVVGYRATCGNKQCIYQNMENTFISRYGSKSGFGTKDINNKISATLLEKYGVDNPAKSAVVWDKMFKKQTSKSKEEDKLYEILKGLYPDLIRNYKSINYNYFADFYIPQYDLYIEYHGSMFHKGHLFNNADTNDINELNALRSKACNNRYSATIYTWTILDNAKYQHAIDNKINYLIIYPMFLNNRNKLRNNNIAKYSQEIQNYLCDFIYNNYNDKTNIQLIIGENNGNSVK